MRKENFLLLHSHTKTNRKNKVNLSIVTATDMNTDTNMLSPSPFTIHQNGTRNCTFLTTPRNWDFTDQADGFQLASHNYVLCLPLHPLPLLSLMLTPRTEPSARKSVRKMKRDREKNLGEKMHSEGEDTNKECREDNGDRKNEVIRLNGWKG